MGSHLLLDAFDGYVLGRPKIDRVEVKFIGDSNTLMANTLAGGVDFVGGTALSTEQALQMREQWRDGKVSLAPDGWLVIYPQFIDPTPPLVLHVQLRRA